MASPSAQPLTPHAPVITNVTDLVPAVTDVMDVAPAPETAAQEDPLDMLEALNPIGRRLKGI
jgi:hypothetical protein